MKNYSFIISSNITISFTQAQQTILFWTNKMITSKHNPPFPQGLFFIILKKKKKKKKKRKKKKCQKSK